MKKTASVVLLMLLFTGVPAIARAFGVQYTGESAPTNVAHALWAKQD